MRKKVFFGVLAIFVLATTSYAKVSVGIRLPFQMLSSISKPTTGKTTKNEMWVGGLGTLEYNFSPTFGIEFGAGYLMSLGGKSKNEYTFIRTKDSVEVDTTVEWEYKNEITSISVLMKIYLPIGKKDSSSISVYFAGGPQIAIVTKKQKMANGEYQKTYAFTSIGLGGLMGLVTVPALKIGFDYSVTEDMKLGSLIEVGFTNLAYEEQKSPTVTLIGFGLGLGLKYCF